MKLKKNAIMAALSFSVAINLNGCVPPFDPSDNANQNAYGPPPLEYRESEDGTEDQNDNETPATHDNTDGINE